MVTNERLDEMISSRAIKGDIPDWFPLEKEDHDLYSVLLELKSRRESDLRPCDKFLTNSIEEQFKHLASELVEIKHEIDKHIPCGNNSERIAEELIDLQICAQTMLAILEFESERLLRKQQEVFEKNRVRGHYSA